MVGSHGDACYFPTIIQFLDVRFYVGHSKFSVIFPGLGQHMKGNETRIHTILGTASPSKISREVKGLLVVFLPGGSAQFSPFSFESGMTGKFSKVYGGLRAWAKVQSDRGSVWTVG